MCIVNIPLKIQNNKKSNHLYLNNISSSTLNLKNYRYYCICVVYVLPLSQ